MGLQLSSTKKKKPFLSSQQTYEYNQLPSPPFCNESFLSSSRTNVSSSSSVGSDSTSSSDNSSCELILADAAGQEQGEDWCTNSSTHRPPIYISSSKHSTSAASTRHKLQPKLTKSEDKEIQTCTLHLKVGGMKTTTQKNKNSQNYFGHITGPTVPLTSGCYTNGRPKPSSMSFEHLAKHHLYYNKKHAYSYPPHHSSHYIGQHVRHAYSSTAAATLTPRAGGRSPQSFGKRKPNSTAAAAAAAAAAVAAAAATQKTAATAGKDTVPRPVFYHGGDESHRLCFSETHSFTSYSFCRWFEASANPSNNNSGFYPLDTPYCAKHVKDAYCPLDALDMLNKLAHWFLFPIANDIDLDTECTYNRYLGVSGSGGTGTSTDAGATPSAEIDIFQGLTSFLSSIVRKVFQIDFSQSVGTTFPDSSIVQQQSPDKEKEKDVKGEDVTSQDDNNHNTSIDTIEPTHTLFHSISSIDSEEARFSSLGTSNNTQQQQRYLDIECILRLPTMIYDEEGSSSDGFVGSIDTYDTDGGKSIKMDHEDTIPADENNKVPCQKGSNHHNAISLEWSWITVPRQKGPSSQSIHSIASLEETVHDVLPSPFQNHNKEDDQCVICLQKFVRGERLCILPCHHSVHTTCIDKWLCTGSGSWSSHHDEELCTRNALCPMCQSPLRIDKNDHPHHLHHGNGDNECLHSIKSIASEESFVMEYHHGVDDSDSIKSMNLDGLVPSWAFERLGSKIAK